MIHSRRASLCPLPAGLCFLAAAASCLVFVGPWPAAAQTQIDVTIPTSLGDATETFWLQIPRDYQPMTPRPLLIGWHQLGGDRHEMRSATRFDSIADARGWLLASHDGVTPTHWNNQATQSHVVDVIRWIEEHYAVDAERIYMVGASMGGAAGMIFANNHLDPGGPMVAAVASLSGIQDCDRRFHEQGINNSMIAAFGGTPDEVPFEYHRNSAIFFADSAQSMHVNARHLPLYLTFGQGTSDQIWREHAEDLYAAMFPFADTVVLRESIYSGHGWGCAEEGRICDFLAAHRLDRAPSRLSIEADEEGRWYWVDLKMRDPVESFARFEAEARPELRRIDFDMIRNVDRAELDLPAVGLPLDGPFFCAWRVLDGMEAALGLRGFGRSPVLVTRDGAPFPSWSYDAARDCLTLLASGEGFYAVLFDAASAPLDPVDGAAPARPAIRLRPKLDGTCGVELPEPGSVRWRLLDAAGRLLLAGEAEQPAAGTMRLDAAAEAGRGLRFLQVKFRGSHGAAQATTKLLRVR